MLAAAFAAARAAFFWAVRVDPARAVGRRKPIESGASNVEKPIDGSGVPRTGVSVVVIAQAFGSCPPRRGISQKRSNKASVGALLGLDERRNAELDGVSPGRL